MTNYCVVELCFYRAIVTRKTGPTIARVRRAIPNAFQNRISFARGMFHANTQLRGS